MKVVWVICCSLSVIAGDEGLPQKYDSHLEHKADLIALATDGRNGFLDALRGSHSERILRYGVAPLLTIPVGSRVSRFLH